jgi:hypothetical protein
MHIFHIIKTIKKEVIMKNFLKIWVLIFIINKLYSDEIDEIKEKINELKREIQKLESLINKDDLKQNPKINQWVEPAMGWEFDYQNNKVYLVDNNGSSGSANVGIGTDNPLGRLHIVGDFYNQGFVGSKSNYNPQVNWVDVSSQSTTTHGIGEDSSIVLVFAHVQHRGEKEIFIRVIRDGSVVVGIASGGGAGATNDDLGATLVTFDEPPAGSHTYKLQVDKTGYLGYQFFVVEIKR